MRKAAGILMIMYGVKAIGLLVSSPTGYLDEKFIDYSFPWGLFVIIPAVFIITGGVFCLKRKYWKLCFASSLVLLLFMIIDFLFLFPFPPGDVTYWWVNRTLFPPWGILPLIFICLRKREWSESKA